MGCYINPPNESKESFLQREGTHLPIPSWDLVPHDALPVCLVHNGAFTAAGIAFDKKEMDEFLSDMAGRPNVWLVVPITKLVAVSTLASVPFYAVRLDQARPNWRELVRR